MRPTLSQQPAISIIGAGSCPSAIYRLAWETGHLCAQAGYVVVCGGLGGVMQGAAEGARAAGGLTVGILPGESADQANPFISIALPTGMSHARNALVVRAGLAVIAVSGGTGTLSEIALALKMGKPVVSLHSWAPTPEVQTARDPADAVALARQAIRDSLGAGHG